MTTNLTNNFRVPVNKNLSKAFNVSRGGVYEVKIRADEINATYSDPIMYYAPPLEHPIEVRATILTNGSYRVDWVERTNLKNDGVRYFYDIFVQEGHTINESTAQVFTVRNPPFIYTNSSSAMYTFAVRVRSEKGLKSVTSEKFTRLHSESIPSESSISTVAIVIPCMLMLALVGVIAFLVIRNRKLHSSFTRFTNSHYDTRSEAATFDDNSLEEDETPQIRGFSDDEPLVIA